MMSTQTAASASGSALETQAERFASHCGITARAHEIPAPCASGRAALAVEEPRLPESATLVFDQRGPRLTLLRDYPDIDKTDELPVASAKDLKHALAVTDLHERLATHELCLCHAA